MSPEEFLIAAKNLGLSITHLRGDTYLINNYFFGRYDTTGELNISGDGFDLKHVKGYWVGIKFPEEIITHNYYEYFLPLSNLGQAPSIPQFWEELYERAGLTSIKTENFRKARMRTLFSKLEEHYSTLNGIKDSSFWKALADEFPECVYFGPAYRAVLVAQDSLNPKLLAQPGYSWALSLTGIKEFLNHGDVYSKKENLGFYLVKGVIKGISLVHIRNFFSQEHQELLSHLSDFKEEEVIALEVISTEVPQFLKIEDLK